MYKHVDIRQGGKRKLGASVGALVITAAMLSFGTGVGYADDTDIVEIQPGSSPTEGPTVKDGVRTPADQGVDNTAATQGIVRNSMKAVPGTPDASSPASPMKAVPTTKGAPSLPDPITDIGWNCLFVWTKLCA